MQSNQWKSWNWKSKKRDFFKKNSYHQLCTYSLPFFTLKSLILSLFSIFQCTIGSFCTLFTIFYQFLILLHLFIFTTKFENGNPSLRTLLTTPTSLVPCSASNFSFRRHNCVFIYNEKRPLVQSTLLTNQKWSSCYRFELTNRKSYKTFGYSKAASSENL